MARKRGSRGKSKSRSASKRAKRSKTARGVSKARTKQRKARVGKRGGKVERAGHKKIDGRHYLRSDTKKIATWNPVRDVKIKAKYKGPSDQPWIGDTREVTIKTKKGKKIRGWI